MDTKKISLTLVIGTARDGRHSKAVADFIVERMRNDERFLVTMVDVQDHLYSETTRLSDGGAAAQRVSPWKEHAEVAQAFLLVVPEYNHGYPGELKILLDSLEDEYAHKPLLLCGVSSGRYGGARVIEHLLPVVIDLGFVPLKKSLYVTDVKTFFSDERKSDREMFVEMLKSHLDELLWFSRRLSS